MKKNISFWFALSSLLVFSSSCEDDRGAANLEPNKVYMAKAGLSQFDVYTLSDTLVYSVSVVKSGFYDTPAVVTVALKESELIKYNETMSASYKLLPASCYNFETTTVTLAPDQLYSKLPVSVNVVELAKLPADELYALPLGITSSDVEVSSLVDGATLMTFSIKDASVSLGLYGENDIPVDPGSDIATIEIPLTVPFNNLWDLTCIFDYSQEVFDEFNETKGGLFEPIPAEAFTISPIPFVIPAGETTAKLTVLVDKSKLQKLNYAFALKLKSVESEKDIVPNLSKSAYYTSISNSVDVPDTDKSWTIEYTSSNAEGDGAPANILDGNLETHWHSSWSGAEPSVEEPVWIVVDLGKEYRVTGVNLAPRMNLTVNEGFFETATIYDGENTKWTRVGNFVTQGKKELQKFPAKPSDARYVKVAVTKKFAQLSMFGIQGVAK